MLFFWAVVAITTTAARADLIGHGGMIRTSAISPNGLLAISGSFDYTAIVWNFGTQSILSILDDHDGPVTAVAFIDDQTVATAADDHTIIVWDITTPENPRIITRLKGHTHKIMALAPSPDGRYLASAGWDNSVRLWTLGPYHASHTIDASTPANALVWTDNTHLAIGFHDGTIALWSLEKTAIAYTLNAGGFAVTALDVTDNGAVLLSAGIDGRIILWDMDKARLLGQYTWHDKQVYGARFGVNDTRIISVGRDGMLIQATMDGDFKPVNLHRFKAHEKNIWSLSLNPDGRFALTSALGNEVRVWHLPSNERIGPRPDDRDAPEPWRDSTHPGAALFSKCAKCHRLRADGTHRSGPHLENLFGRRMGTVKGYGYSDALLGREVIWNRETLRALFTDGPDVFVPGTKMPVQRMGNPVALDQLINYLAEATRTDSISP